MKRIYVILLTAALSAAVFSCEEKSPADKANDHEMGEGVKDSTLEEELDKTTKNGGDAH